MNRLRPAPKPIVIPLTGLPLMVMFSCTNGMAPALDDSGSWSDSGTSPRTSIHITPLFDEDTSLEDELVFERDGAIVTQFSDRGRDRHARVR